MPQDGVRTFLPLRPRNGRFTLPLLGSSQRSPGSPAILIIRCSGSHGVRIRTFRYPSGQSSQRTEGGGGGAYRDRKSTRLNSSHRCISYAVFCLKKKKDER